MSHTSHPAEFGKLRAFFWPIHKEELKKFLPMGLMMFFILFVYTILRSSKDALVVSAGGASVLPFLKGYVVFPAAILFVVMYSKLLNLFSSEKVFYIIVSIFVSFYLLFGFVLYPLRDILHPSAESVAIWKEQYPNLKHFISIFATWSYSLFYVFAELWGSSMVSLLFWQFANQITKTQEAKRFYAMFGLLANFALIGAGFYIKSATAISRNFSDDAHVSWMYNLFMICGGVSGACILIMMCYRYMQTNVLTDKRFYDPEANKGSSTSKKKKEKLSIKDSFMILLESKYLLMIALLVLCYGISINLVEFLWKTQMQIQFPNPSDYNHFMSNLFIWTGIATILVILFSKEILRKAGWFMGAIATPLMILATGILFFGFIFFSNVLDPLVSMVGISALLMSVWVGTIQNVLSKAVKYGLFDPTKEMAYIPLNDEQKTRGKAAVEVIGGRLGKASGGYITSGLLIILGAEASEIRPHLALFFGLVLIVWMFAVVKLNSMYNEKVKEEEKS